MIDTDKSYYRLRADEEFAAAEGASCPEASRVHRELAERYSAMAQSDTSICEAAHSRFEENSEASSIFLPQVQRKPIQTSGFAFREKSRSGG